MSLDNS